MSSSLSWCCHHHCYFCSYHCHYYHHYYQHHHLTLLSSSTCKNIIYKPSNERHVSTIFFSIYTNYAVLIEREREKNKKTKTKTKTLSPRNTFPFPFITTTPALYLPNFPVPPPHFHLLIQHPTIIISFQSEYHSLFVLHETLAQPSLTLT